MLGRFLKSLRPSAKGAPPFEAVRTVDGLARGEQRFLVAAMFTAGYAEHAQRLRESLERTGLPYLLHEVASVHSSTSAKGTADPRFTKANYVRHLLERHRRPVLYVDADVVFRERPALIERLAADGTSFAAYNWVADAGNDAFYPVDVRLGGQVVQDRYFQHSHRIAQYSTAQLICSGCVQYYDTSPAAAALLERWHRTVLEHPRAPDDQALAFAYNNGGSAIPGLRSFWLPKEYARYAWWIFSRPVIDHPQYPSLVAGFEPMRFAGPERDLYAERCTTTAARFPAQAVLDARTGQLYEFEEGRLVRPRALERELWIAPGNRTSRTLEVAAIVDAA